MYRLGLIGCGNISTTFTDGIRECSDLSLQAICSAGEKNLNLVGDREQIPAGKRFRDYRKILQSDDIDAVIICTPNNLHYRMAVDAIQYRKPFLLEKPITTTLESAKKLQIAAEKSGILNSINYSYRFKPEVRYLRHLIDRGCLGRIYHIYVHYFQGWAAKPDRIMFKRRCWRFNKEISGSGALGDLGTHMIDLTRFLIGEFVEVSADMDTFIKKRIGEDGEEIIVDVDDYVHINAGLEGGVKGNYGITRYASGRGNYMRLELYGEKGSIVYKLDRKDSIKISLGEVYQDSNVFSEITVPDDFKISRMQSFADILKGKEDVVNPTISDGYRTQCVVKALLDSQDSGMRVKIDNR
jgi:predicted dehydrogenase